MSGQGASLGRWGLLAACIIIACASLGACAPEDTVHTFAFAPSSNGGEQPHANGGTIEAGRPLKLDARQQEAVVGGVSQWLKDSKSAQFGAMQAVRDSRGVVTVCGWVDGRNSAGVYRGMAPYIGILVGTRHSADFIVVGIGGSRQDRASVLALCVETGAATPHGAPR